MMIGDSVGRSAEPAIDGGAPQTGDGRAEISPEVLLLTEHHDRLAHDLNDTLIRQMFAVSLDLHAALSHIEYDTGDRHAAEKIRHAIVGLDQAIDDIRDGAVAANGLGGRRRRDR
jgi:hypothetical protein